jgi:hypothetical protein
MEDADRHGRRGPNEDPDQARGWMGQMHAVSGHDPISPPRSNSESLAKPRKRTDACSW